MSQIALDITNCKNVPQDIESLERIMVKCANLIGATIVESCFHEFSPWGLSGVLVIAESHIAVHTYPEFNTIQIDLFTCGEMDYKDGLNYLHAEFGGDHHIQKINRKMGPPNILPFEPRLPERRTSTPFKILSDSLFNLFSLR